MKEKIDFNNNGHCIQSRVKHFESNRWIERHVTCKKPTDIDVPILLIFKNKRDKKNNLPKYSILLHNYVGIECAFQFRNQTHTMAIITGDCVYIFAFEMSESLIIWETWIRDACGQTISFFMQLKKAPPSFDMTNVLLKEVRCHVHDGRVAVVHSIPQKVLLYCRLASTQIELEDHFITIYPDPMRREQHFLFLCAMGHPLSSYIETARSEEGALHRLLNRQKLEGDWLPSRPQTTLRRVSQQHSSQATVNMSELRVTPEPTQQMRIVERNIVPYKMIREKSQSGIIYKSPLHDEHLPLMRTSSSVAQFGNSSEEPLKQQVENVEIKNEEVAEKKEASNDKLNDYYNFFSKRQSSSMDIGTKKIGGIEKVASKSNNSIKSEGSKFERFLRRSDSSVNNSRNVQPSSGKGRSFPDFSMPFDAYTRHESWRRAKKFFSAFKPKSQSDLLHKNSMTRNSQEKLKKSSSTGALMFTHSLAYNPRRPSESASEVDDRPPLLNIAVTEQPGMMSFVADDSQPPPEGLVRPRDDILMHARSGVGAVLKRRLASSVRGSFTKYDGDKGTHMYKTALTVHKPIDEIYGEDGVETAVLREQERRRLQDRRASNLSTHKTAPNPNPPNYAPPSDYMKPPPPPPKPPSTLSATKKSLLKHLTWHRNSNSHSDATKSSNESLSSELKNKIFVYKKSDNSPPKRAAPVLSPPPKVRKISSSSNDSHLSVSLPIPKKTSIESSSTSSSESTFPPPASIISNPEDQTLSNRLEFISIQADTLANESTKKTNDKQLFSRSRSISLIDSIRRPAPSQDPSSTSSSPRPFSKQGFFRKYRTLRRAKKEADSSA